MKKTVITTILGLSACVSSFAQGNVAIINAPGAVWENLSTGGPFIKAAAVLEVAMMWSADTNAIPTTFLNGAATPTNGIDVASWTGIFTDPNFQLAHSTTAGNPVIVTTCGGPPGPAAGHFNAGLQYISGTTPLQTIQLYVIGWDKSFGIDPIAAAISGAAVGFSAPIQYTLGSTVAPGGSLGIAGLSSFGVGVPEPTTFALASLGAAALLIFRRRRQH
jgi:hypothetical protein